MKKLANVLFYSGLNKEDYRKVLPAAREENRKNLTVFSFLAFLAFFSALMARIFTDFGMGIRSMEAIAAIFFAMTILALTVARKYKYVCDTLVYIYTLLLLGSGVYAGVSQPQARTTLLLAFYIFSAVIFCEKLIIYIGIVACTEMVYLAAISGTQSGDVLITNCVNSLIFCSMGIFSAIYIMNMKFTKHKADYTNKYLLERDSLTSAFNRRHFELELENIKKSQQPICICAFDVNELKQMNDKFGHAVGDELIVGAAKCIQTVVGGSGKVFRTGGDEFVAIVPYTGQNTEEMLQKFKDTIAAWKGENIDVLEVSCGIVILKEDFENKLTETLKQADMLMYQEKRNYYQRKGIERRRQ